MKLIIVERSQVLTYQRLLEKFSDDLNVRVIFDRRKTQLRRRPGGPHAPERRSRERRRLVKPYNEKHYVVINVVVNPPTRKLQSAVLVY